MKVDEIRAVLEEQKSKFREAFEKPADESIIPACVASAQIAFALFTGEIALQLAELNEKLTPASMVASIREIQQTIDQLDPA